MESINYISHYMQNNEKNESYFENNFLELKIQKKKLLSKIKSDNYGLSDLDKEFLNLMVEKVHFELSKYCMQSINSPADYYSTFKSKVEYIVHTSSVIYPDILTLSSEGGLIHDDENEFLVMTLIYLLEYSEFFDDKSYIINHPNIVKPFLNKVFFQLLVNDGLLEYIIHEYKFSINKIKNNRKKKFYKDFLSISYDILDTDNRRLTMNSDPVCEQQDDFVIYGIAKRCMMLCEPYFTSINKEYRSDNDELKVGIIAMAYSGYISKYTSDDRLDYKIYYTLISDIIQMIEQTTAF